MPPTHPHSQATTSGGMSANVLSDICWTMSAQNSSVLRCCWAMFRIWYLCSPPKPSCQMDFRCTLGGWAQARKGSPSAVSWWAIWRYGVHGRWDVQIVHVNRVGSTFRARELGTPKPDVVSFVESDVDLVRVREVGRELGVQALDQADAPAVDGAKREGRVARARRAFSNVSTVWALCKTTVPARQRLATMVDLREPSRFCRLGGVGQEKKK
jgi:hypothetical protein